MFCPARICWDAAVDLFSREHIWWVGLEEKKKDTGRKCEFAGEASLLKQELVKTRNVQVLTLLSVP